MNDNDQLSLKPRLMGYLWHSHMWPKHADVTSMTVFWCHSDTGLISRVNWVHINDYYSWPKKVNTVHTGSPEAACKYQPQEWRHGIRMPINYSYHLIWSSMDEPATSIQWVITAICCLTCSAFSASSAGVALSSSYKLSTSPGNTEPAYESWLLGAYTTFLGQNTNDHY